MEVFCNIYKDYLHGTEITIGTGDSVCAAIYKERRERRNRKREKEGTGKERKREQKQEREREEVGYIRRNCRRVTPSISATLLFFQLFL